MRLSTIENNNNEYWKSSSGLIVEYSCGSYPPDGFSAVTHLVLYDTSDVELYKVAVAVPKNRGAGILTIPDVYFEPGNQYQLVWKAEINVNSAIAASSVFYCVDDYYKVEAQKELDQGFFTIYSFIIFIFIFNIIIIITIITITLLLLFSHYY